VSLVTPRDPGGTSGPVAGARAAGVVAWEAVSARARTRLWAAVATSTGHLHAINEDCHSPLDCRDALFVVADGVGGGAHAARASAEVVARLHATLGPAPPDRLALCDALLDTDRAVGSSITRHGGSAGAATVALCAAVDDALVTWRIAWVGDCRIYRVALARLDAAQLLTVDDTYRHLGEAPPAGGSPDDPARMVGNGAVDTPNIRDIELRSDDVLMLCSDGVHKHAGDADIARVLRERAPLARRCAQLIELARANGSRDDATVMVVQRSNARARAGARRVAVSIGFLVVTATLLWLVADTTFAGRVAPAMTSLQSGGER